MAETINTRCSAVLSALPYRCFAATRCGRPRHRLDESYPVNLAELDSTHSRSRTREFADAALLGAPKPLDERKVEAAATDTGGRTAGSKTGRPQSGSTPVPPKYSTAPAATAIAIFVLPSGGRRQHEANRRSTFLIIAPAKTHRPGRPRQLQVPRRLPRTDTGSPIHPADSLVGYDPHHIAKSSSHTRPTTQLGLQPFATGSSVSRTPNDQLWAALELVDS